VSVQLLSVEAAALGTVTTHWHSLGYLREPIAGTMCHAVGPGWSSS